MKLLCILSATLFLLLTSCSPQNEKETEIERIESYIDTNPDSALSDLDAIEISLSDPERVRARFALAKTRGLYKTKKEIPDSLMNFVVEFYRSTDNLEAKMHSFLIRGYSMSTKSLPSAAITDLLSAEEYALKLNDHFNLGMIYRNIGRVYNSVSNFNEDLRYSELALSELQKFGNDSYTDEATFEYAQALNNTGRTARARNILNRLKSKIKDTNNVPYYPRIQKLEAYILINENKFEEAFKLLKGLSLDDRFDYHNLINLALVTGNYSFADSIVQSAGDSISVPVDYWVHHKDYPKALDASLKDFDQISEFYSIQSGKGFASTVSNYYRSKEERISYQAYRQKTLFLLIISILTILLLIGTLTWFIIYLRKKKLETIFVASVLTLNQEIQSMQTSFEREKERLINKSLLSGRVRELDKLCIQYYALSSSNNSQKNIASHIAKLVESLSSNSDLYANLEHSVDIAHNQIVSKFKSDYHDLKPIDYKLFVYKASGFSGSSINLLLKEDPKSIYNRTYRLKQKIEKSDSESKAEYLEILNSKPQNQY